MAGRKIHQKALGRTVVFDTDWTPDELPESLPAADREDEVDTVSRKGPPQGLDALCMAEFAQWPVEVTEAAAVGRPATREQLAARLQWAIRTLFSAAHDSKAVDARARDRAISIVAMVLGHDPSSTTKLDRLAARFTALGAYLHKVSTQRARASGKPPGRADADRLATIGLQTLLGVVLGEAPGSGRRVSLYSMCKTAAEQFAKQEGFTKAESIWAVPFWAERTRTLYKSQKRPWRPASVKEALIADKVKRGVRIGAKLPEQPAD